MGSREELGENIKKARLKASMTQLEVSQKAGIHVNYFSRIERGEINPSFEVMQAIAKVLKMMPSEIFPL